jgi:ABC-2 type transport system ATP-binding protein
VSGDSLVRIERLTRRYGELVAVEDLSLEVYQGEMLGLIGPDGAGKTTTIRVLLGLLAPNRGRVETCGLDPLARRYELSQKVGYLSQRFSLYGDLTVDENIAFFAEIHGLRKWKPRREELLEMVRMTPFRSRLAERLSGGMKQKLALACTLIHTPELLVLDEPTTGVDPVSRRDFILLTTPYLDEAERCERVAFLDHGRLLVVDTPDALRGSITGAFLEVVARPRQQVVEYLRSRDGVSGLEIFGDRIHVTLTEVDPALAAAQARELEAELLGAGLTVDLIRASEPTLEDTFIHWIRAENAKRQVALSQSPA